MTTATAINEQAVVNAWPIDTPDRILRAMAGRHGSTVHQLAHRTGIAVSIVRDWLGDRVKQGLLIFNSGNDTYKSQCEVEEPASDVQAVANAWPIDTPDRVLWAMAGSHGSTVDQISQRTGIEGSIVREWLNGKVEQDLLIHNSSNDTYKSLCEWPGVATRTSKNN